MAPRIRAFIACAGLALGLGACQLTGEPVPTTTTVQEPIDTQYYASDEPLKLGMEHFGRGNFGLSERYFRDAVEKAPREPGCLLLLIRHRQTTGDQAERPPSTPAGVYEIGKQRSMLFTSPTLLGNFLKQVASTCRDIGPHLWATADTHPAIPAHPRWRDR